MSHLLSKVRWGQPWSKGKHQASRIHSQILIIKYYLMNKIKLNKILFMIASESKIKENYERLQKKKEWDRKGMNKKRFIFEEIRQKEGMNKREYIIDAFCFGHSLFVSAALLHNVCHYLHVPPFSGFLEQNDSANICPHILVEERKQKVDSDPHGHQLPEMCITGGKALCRSQLCLWLTPDTLRLLSVLVLRPLPPAALAPPTQLTAPGYPSRRGWVNDLRVTMIYWQTASKDCFLSYYLLSSPQLS